MAKVVLSSLSHRFEGADRDTLTDIDLTIDDGEAHALLGSSGAGKSTLLNLIAGLLVPSSGHVEFDGRAVDTLAPRARNVAFVFQFPVLYEGLSIAANIAFPLVSRGHPNPDARAREVAHIVGLEDLERRPAGLGLYERQLVALAKAIARDDVSAVLLDEPLTAVEPTAKWRLRRVLRSVHQKFGVTMIYVTHDQTEALTFADRVTVLHEGRVLQTGAPIELIETPAHAHVGHFIGAPGMNFLPGGVLDPRLEAHTVGFRPDWARLERDYAPGTLGAIVVATQPTGTSGGTPFGIAVAQTADGTTVKTVQPLTVEPGAACRLVIDRRVTFQNDWRVTDPTS